MAVYEKGTAQIERNKEGVPCWDGNAATFQEYSVMSQKPGWISHEGGVQKLLDHLRRHLGQPQLTEMSEYMMKYFKQTKRRRNETMNDYITRKAEVYARACLTLDRVQKRFSPPAARTWARSSQRASDSMSTISPAPPAEQDDQAQGQEPDPAEHDAEDEEAENGSGNDWRWNQSWWQSGDWYHRDWWQESWHRSTYDTSDSWTSEVAELLPTFVQGCCKMQDLRYMNGT